MQLTLYTSPYCACSRADIDALRALVTARSDVEFNVIDVTKALEDAAKGGIRRTPTLVLDGEILSGTLLSDTEALLQLIASRMGVG